MKLKLTILVPLIAISIVLLFSQAAFANAKLEGSQNPITNPITYYKLSGKVLYRYLSWLRNAPNVTVTASSQAASSSYTTVTDTLGNYTFTIPPDTYAVSAYDSKGTTFSPSSITVVLNQDISRIDFVGILKSKPQP